MATELADKLPLQHKKQDTCVVRERLELRQRADAQIPNERAGRLDFDASEETDLCDITLYLAR